MQNSGRVYSRDLGRDSRDPASHGGAIFSAVPKYLIALGQSGQSVRHRHLAALVAFESHLLQDLATGQAVALPDQLEQRLPPAATARSRLPTGRRLPCVLAGFRSLIGFNGGKLAIYRVEFALQLFLLAEDLLALRAEPVPLSRNKLGKAMVCDVAFIIKIGYSCSPLSTGAEYVGMNSIPARVPDF